jgi:hypothetical protein
MLSKYTNLLVYTLLKKTMRDYEQKYDKKLPYIAIVGSVGKSSQTQLLSQVFNKADYKVLSSKKNTINGLGMILGEFDTSFEGNFSFFKKIGYIITIIWKILFFKINLPQKSILIQEVGFDHQGEANDFDKFFEGNLDTCVVTALTDEHNQNYSNSLNMYDLELLSAHIPDELYLDLKQSEVLDNTKNVIIEMLKPVKYAENFYLPLDINKLSNSIFQGNMNSYKVVFPLIENIGKAKKIQKFSIDNNYLLPFTFAKTLYVVIDIAKKYNICDEIISECFLNLDLPKGRFSKLKGVKNSVLIDSSYNSDPDSVLLFLDSLKIELENQSNGEYDIIKHNIILGEMRELGDISIDKHKIILDNLRALKLNYTDKIEKIVLLGETWKLCDEQNITKVDGVKSYIAYNGLSYTVYDKAGDIYRDFQEEIRPFSWYWIKGSQNTIFLEILVEKLLLDPKDKTLLCRQEERWLQLRKKYE